MGKWMTLRVQVAILLLMIQMVKDLQYLAKMMDCILRQVDTDPFLFHLPCDFGLGKKKDEICGFGIFLFMTRFNCFY